MSPARTLSVLTALSAGLTLTSPAWATAKVRLDHDQTANSGVAGAKTSSVQKDSLANKYDELALNQITLALQTDPGNNSAATCGIGADFGLLAGSAQSKPDELGLALPCLTNADPSKPMQSGKITATGAHHYVGAVQVCQVGSSHVDGIKVFFRKVDNAGNVSAVGNQEWKLDGSLCTWGEKQACPAGYVAYGIKGYVYKNNNTFTGINLMCAKAVAN